MVTLNARVCQQQIAQQASFSMPLVQLAPPTSGTLTTGCLHVPLVPCENCHTLVAVVTQCLAGNKSQVMNLSYTIVQPLGILSVTLVKVKHEKMGGGRVETVNP